MKQLNMYKFLRYFSKYLNEMLFPLLVYNTTKSVTLTMLYLVLFSIFSIVSNLLFKKLILRHIVLSLVLGVVVTVVAQFLVIATTLNVYVYVVFISFLTGLDGIMAYSTMEYLYNRTNGSEDIKNIRNTFIIEILALTLGPICGGIFIEYWGKLANAIIASSLSVASIIYFIPYLIRNEKEFLTNNNDYTNSISSNNTKKLSLLKHQKIILVCAVVLMGLVGVMNRLEFSFSIYLSILNVSYLEAGLINGLITIGQIVFAIITYFIQLKNKNTLLLIITSVCMSALWIAKPFLTNTFSLYFLTVLSGLIYPFLFQPIKFIYVSSLKKYSHPHSMLYMEESIRQGGAGISSLIGLIFSFLGTAGLNIMFVVSAISYLSIPFISILIDKLSLKNE